MKKILIFLFMGVFTSIYAQNKRVDQQPTVNPVSGIKYVVVDANGLTRLVDAVTAQKYAMPKVAVISGTLGASGNSAYLGSFVKESNGTVVTAYVDSSGVKHTLTPNLSAYATTAALQTESQDRVNSANAIINAMDADRAAVDTAKSNIRAETANNINYGDSTSRVRDSLLNAQKLAKSELTLQKVLEGGNTSSLEATFLRVIGRGNMLSHSSNSLFGTGMYNAISGTNNIGCGRDVMGLLTTGISNTAFGSATMYANKTGNYNTAVGFLALRQKVSGNFSTAIGGRAMWNDTVGNWNTVVGWETYSNAQGNSNTAVGFQAGILLQRGDNNIAIGSGANLPELVGDNQLSIGNWIVGKDGRISIGGSSVPINSFEVAGTDAIRAPNGTTAERPTSIQFGQLRYNTTLGRGEMYVNDENGDGTQGDAGWRVF